MNGFLWVVLSFFVNLIIYMMACYFFIVMFALNCDACDLDRIQKMFFLCVAYGQYSNMFWMFFLYKKNIGSFENVFSHRFLKHKLFSCISGFYNMFVKLQRVLANIPKNIKILFLGNSSIIRHLCLDKEIPKGWISKILLGIICYYSPLMFG